MLKYLIFITIGILLYLLLNRYNKFSIGVQQITYYLIPYHQGMTTISPEGIIIDIQRETEQTPAPTPPAPAPTPAPTPPAPAPTPAPTPPAPTTFATTFTTLQPYNENTFATYEGETQQYWITTINPDSPENIQTILDNIEQERERLESERLERERLERLESERLERLERQERERLERLESDRLDFVNRWYLIRTPTDQVNRLRTGHIIAYVNEGTTIIRQLNVNDTARPLGIPTIEIDELTEITDLYYVIRLDEQVTEVPYWRNTIQMTGTILGMGGDTNIDINIRSLLSILRYLPLDMVGVTGGPFNFIEVFNRLSASRLQYRTHLLQIITAFLTLQLGGTRQNILNIGQLFRYLNYRGEIPGGVVTTGRGGATTGGTTTGGGAPSDATQEVPDVVISGTGATMTFRRPSTRRHCATIPEGIPPPRHRE